VSLVVITRRLTEKFVARRRNRGRLVFEVRTSKDMRKRPNGWWTRSQ
jgi:hypothetical protein